MSICCASQDATENVIVDIAHQLEYLMKENKEIKHNFEILKSTTESEIYSLKEENAMLKEQMKTLHVNIDKVSEDKNFENIKPGENIIDHY